MSTSGGAFRSKRWRIVAIVAGTFLAGGFTFLFTAPKEPVYQGRSLFWWSEEYEQKLKEGGAWDTDPFVQESEDALRAIGVNAIPTLLRWSQAPDSPFKNKINRLLDKQPFIAFRFRSAQRKWSMANEGFELLGYEAMPAVPALTRLLESPSHDQQLLAFDSILAIAGDNKVLLPVIVQSLQTKDNMIRSKAAIYIYMHYPDRCESTGATKVLLEVTRTEGAGFLAKTLPQSK